jgi:hypothetical protein
VPIDFDRYCQRYLREWDRRATVRTRPCYRLSAAMAAREMFPAFLVPIIEHEAVVALGKEARHTILARTACDFQEAIAIIEVDVVTDLCGKLANQGIGVRLPASARKVALTIATDEVYHAYAAREFIADVEHHTGITHEGAGALGEARTPIEIAVDYIKQTAPPEFLRPAETMALCFAENFVTEELFELSKDTDPKDAFHATLREHLIDEGRHQIFFQNLMRHMWAEIDEEARVALGRLIPGYLEIFLRNPTRYKAEQERILGFLGFDRENSQRIVSEAIVAAFGSSITTRDKMATAKRPLNLIKIARILDHKPTREVLIESGWIAA